MFKNWRRLIFSPFVLKEKRSRKIAYVAMMVALAIMVNIYEIPSDGSVQWSFTTAVSILVGILVGPISGFAICFLGDGLGFAVHPKGAYTPWIGISTGMMALISGMVFLIIKNRSEFALYLKLAVISIVTLLICSIGINTTFFWGMYNRNVPYFKYLLIRYIFKLQIIVSIVNYVLIFILIPVIRKVPFFKSLEL